MKNKNTNNKTLRCDHCGIETVKSFGEGERCPITGCRGTLCLIRDVILVKPLKRVIGEIVQDKSAGTITWKATLEVLECGHLQIMKKDFYGEYSAARRRCSKCGQNLPPDLSTDELSRYR